MLAIFLSRLFFEQPVEKRDATTSLISTINQLTALANQSDAIDKRVNLMTAATQGRMVSDFVASLRTTVITCKAEPT